MDRIQSTIARLQEPAWQQEYAPITPCLWCILALKLYLEASGR